MKSAVTWTVTSLHVIWGLSGYLHFFVCFLVLVSSLVMELSSVYSSSVMVKDFFEFFFLEVLEPESLCTPQSWGFFSQILFQIFFPVPVLFPLWGSDGASVAAVLLSADLGVCARCCQSRSFPSACLPVRPPFFCHLQPARDAICDISASVIIRFSSKLPLHPSSRLLFPHWGFWAFPLFPECLPLLHKPWFLKHFF